MVCSYNSIKIKESDDDLSGYYFRELEILVYIVSEESG